jgi:general secretion pathway protein G
MKRFGDCRERGGFTLIEVLLVMVILVVLASFVVLPVGPIRKKMMEDRAKAQIGMLETAIQTYELDLGTPPATLEALRVMPSDLPNPAKWNGPYLAKDVPLDPWDNYYQYAAPGTRNPDSFDIWTISPEGREIGNWAEETTR